MSSDEKGGGVTRHPVATQLQELHEAVRRLAAGGGGSHFDGMEARVATLEAHAAHIQSDVAEIRADIREIKREARADFRITWGAIIAATLGLAGLLAKGFGWL